MFSLTCGDSILVDAQLVDGTSSDGSWVDEDISETRHRRLLPCLPACDWSCPFHWYRVQLNSQTGTTMASHGRAAGGEGRVRGHQQADLEESSDFVTTRNISTLSQSQRAVARAAETGISAILSCCRCSQRMPGGRCGSAHHMASSGVTMRSTRKS
jgi:hypothetical protein